MISTITRYLPLSQLLLIDNPPLAERGGRSNTPQIPQTDFLKLCPAYVSDEVATYRYFLTNYSTSTVKNNKKKEVEIVHPLVTKKPIVDIGLDYLMGMIKNISTDVFTRLCKYLSDVFEVELDYSDEPKHHGNYRFEERLTSPVNGLKIFYKLNLSGTYTLALICPGKSLRPLPTADIFEFMTRVMSVFKCKFTRIDVRLDDYRKRVSFGYLHRLAVRGDVAGAQKRLYMNGGLVSDKGNSKSESMYLGSKRQQLNIYNADFLHDIDAYRWEGRFREKRCTNICNFIVDNYDEFSNDPDSQLLFLLQYLGNMVLNIAKFIKRNGDKKQAISRFKRHPFYQSLLDDVGELDPEILKIEPDPKLNTVEFVRQSFDWLNRTCFKRIQLLIQAFGKKFFYRVFDGCLANAADRFNSSDYIRMRDVMLFFDDIALESHETFYKELVFGR